MAKCGHVNLHSYGPDGKPDNLECTLDAGHSGPHSAPHYEIAYSMSGSLGEGEADAFVPKTDEQGRVYLEGSPVRHWEDMAGIPAKDIQPDSPGKQLVQSPEMFPEKQAEELAALKEEMAELKKALAKK